MRLLKMLFIIPLMITYLVLSPFSINHAEATTKYYTSLGTYKAVTLTDIEKIIKKSMQNRETTVVIKYKGNTNKLLDVISGYISKAIKADEYLNFSYRSVNMSYEAYGTNVTITLEFKYYETANQINYVNKQVKAILSKIINPGMNDHEKVKAVHDYLVLNLAYDTRLINNSPYPALTKGVTACNGYAMLAYKMLKELGIDVRLISGVASSDSFNTQNHAWNMVKLDGKWYHFDVTWDDPIPDESGRIYYDYYLLTDAEISKNHSWKTGGLNGEEKPYPAATTSYFYQLQVKLNTTEANRFNNLIYALELQYLLPQLTANNLSELSNLVSKEFGNYKKEFSIRYVDKNGDLSSSIRQLLYNSAVEKKVKSWSFVTNDYVRGTSYNDKLITISDITYQR